MPEELPYESLSTMDGRVAEPVRGRRFRWGVAVAVAVPVLLAGAVIVFDRVDAGEAADCEAAHAQDAEKIRTERIATEAVLPGIGAYEQIHWRRATSGSACDRGIPDQWEWSAEGVIELRAEDAAALRDAHEWKDAVAQAPYGSSAPVPFTLSAALQPYAPADAVWRQCADCEYGEDGFPLWVEFLLDAEHGYAYFSFSGDGMWSLMNPNPSVTG